jgi:hypothetical protein
LSAGGIGRGITTRTGSESSENLLAEEPSRRRSDVARRREASLGKEASVEENTPIVSNESGSVAVIGRFEDYVPEVGKELRRITGESAVDDLLADLKIAIDVEVQEHQPAARIIRVCGDPVGDGGIVKRCG